MTPLSALLGALGMVFFAFGLLSLMLGIFGAPTLGSWIGANFFAGIALLVTALVVNLEHLRDRVRSGEGRRIGRYGSSAVAQTLLLLVIVGLLGFLANRYYWRFDVSESGVHSLSSQSLQLLENLDRDVRAVSLHRGDARIRVRDLLDRYAYASDHFGVEYHDPNARPDLVEKYELSQGGLERGQLVIEIGDEIVKVEEVNEQRVTNAILNLTRSDSKKVYFVVGHNERPIEGQGADEPIGYRQAADALGNENYEVAPLLLAASGEIPDDADVVIIAGPTQVFENFELRALERYIEAGGALLVAVDPRANTNLGEALSQWGAELGDDIVIDPLQSFQSPLVPFAAVYSASHPITNKMREYTLFPEVRSVRAAGGGLAAMISTSENSWAERNLELLFSEAHFEQDGDDLGGPVAVAVAGRPAVDATSPSAGEAPPEPRLVVFGDSDFAANHAIAAVRNKDLFVNSVNWLLGDIESITIRPSSPRASRVLLSNADFNMLRPLALFVLPELLMIAGVLVWWRRRAAAV
jgi:ABC-type uncharacterized transport system involved in gliding motility auxiliary subunit